MRVGADTLGIQHARKASEMASEVSGVNEADLKLVFWNLTNHINNLLSPWNFPKLSVPSLTVWNGNHSKSSHLFENLQFLLCSYPLNISKKT